MQQHHYALYNTGGWWCSSEDKLLFKQGRLYQPKVEAPDMMWFVSEDGVNYGLEKRLLRLYFRKFI